MKLTIALLLFFTFQASANGYAQKITIVKKNASLTEIFKAIERQTGFLFFYDKAVIQKSGPVDIAIKNATLDQALSACLKGQNLIYSIVKNTVVIMPEKKTVFFPAQATLTQMEAPEPPPIEIHGRVVNSEGDPLPNVSVLISGTTIGTTTNSDGRFTLTAPDNRNIVLEVSSVGYQAKKIKLGERTNINVVLDVSTSGLSEVVVVGYGTKSREELTGSVTQIEGDVVNKSPSINIASSLQGLLPGATAIQVSGEPGRNNPTMYIRGMSTTGNTSPLVVVDGVPDVPGWQYINSNDIQSISILKDASAAIYGARAANGVILITTKRGSTGKPAITYTFNQGLTQPTMLPKLANSAEFAGYVNQLQVEAGQNPIYTPEEIRKFADGSDPLNYRNTNWYDFVVKKVSTQSQHNLNVRGGNERVKYSLSGSFSNQESVFKKGSTNFKTYGLRSNVDIKANDNIKFGLDINAGINNGNYPAYSTSTVFQALLQVPFMPVYWPNGLPSAGIEQGQNPAVMVTDATGNNNLLDRNFFGKASATINIPWIKGLSIDGFFAYTNDAQINKNWQTPWTVYEYDKATDTYIPHGGGRINAPQLTQAYNNIWNQLLDLRLNYQTNIGNNRIEAFVAGEQSNGVLSSFSAFRRDFISPAIAELFAGSLSNQQTNGTSSQTGRRNLFGRLSYGFQGKYLLDFNFRYDGSSNFAPGKQFGFFPGVSAAWRISEEGFFKSDFINNLKLRASYGEIGNDQITPFQYLTLYTLGSQGYNFGAIPTLNQGLVAGVTPNPDVTWEVLKVSNVGLDVSLGSGLLDLTLDVFKQRRSNILATRALAIPIYTGLILPSENIGIVENKGLEFQATTARKTENVGYKVRINFAYSRNKVIDLSEPTNVPNWQLARDHVLNAPRLYQAIGIFRTQDEVDHNPVYPGTKVGDLQYRDVNGDGKITSADMVRIDKTNIPRITYGFNFSISFHRLSLWANFYGQAQSWQPLHLNVRNAINGLEEVVINRYTPGSMDSKYPRLPTLEMGNTAEVDGQDSDFWLFNTSYMRLKTLELGYNISETFLRQIGIQALRVYLNGNDLFTISKLKLFDPANTNQGGFYYPLMRVYNLGVNVSF